MVFAGLRRQLPIQDMESSGLSLTALGGPVGLQAVFQKGAALPSVSVLPRSPSVLRPWKCCWKAVCKQL